MEDDDHDCDPDSAAAGPCCSSPSAAVRWRRSVKRKLGEEKRGGGGDGEEEGAGAGARVEAEEETAALREALAAAQATAAALRGEVEEERLAAASAASEAMAMMLRLQREKAEVQMELRQFRRFADEKMALDAAEIDHLRGLVARRARHLARARSRLHAYQQTCLRLGIPLPDAADEAEGRGHGHGEGGDGFLEGEGDGEGEDGDYYPELRCYNGEYYYDDGLEGSEEDAVGADLERRICLLEHGHDGDVLGQPSLEEEEEGEEGAHLYAEEALLEPAGQETTGFSADEVLHEETVEQRSHLCDDDELPESPIAGYGVEEGGSDDDGSGSGSDRVYMIDKVHQGAAAPTARVLEKYEDEALEPDIKTLYMRLEALEADRESMRQALLGMRTEKAQLMLLREIAQQLAKDAAPVGTGAGSVPVLHHLPRKQAVGVADTTVREDKKTAPAGTFSKPLLFKWAIALFCSRKKKPSQSRYTFGLSSNNVGLLILLDKCPRIQKTLMRRK
ncbi:myosin-binding protein 7-like [Triticum urartu]|uniref:GTD-binding domain-containing protein n=1 Tax=Triticum urartu TaxID=4572 RepID=A0A8R7UIU6_TRIUA|nr:myosin-binding protein 7-like [Triticum urartu]